MSEGERESGGSRPTNSNNSVTPSQTGSSEDSERELPTVDECVSEFYEQYPERASMPISQRHGQTLRRDYVHERYEPYTSDEAHEMDDTVSGEELVERKPVTWSQALENTLESYDETRRTTLNLELGVPSDPEYTEFSVDVSTRWFPSYQKSYYAQMKGWLRELCGGERPSGGETTSDFTDPYIALITLSASSVPDGERVGPVDHVSERRSAWSDGCYDTLRNTMRRLGMDWQYDRRSEPHTGERGGSTNHCYGHDHLVLVVDGEIRPSDLRPVVDKWVEQCPWAGESAHQNSPCSEHTDAAINPWDAAEPGCEDCDTVISVRESEEVEDLARYVASYAAIRPVDLFERSTEYMAWAAACDAANVRTISRSDAAKWASTADACKQRYESPQSDQEHNHGERIRPSTSRGVEYECSECGSPHGIDQDHDSLTFARTAAADGGVDRRERLQQQWPDARAAATVGEGITRTEWRNQIEQYLERYPDASPGEILGALELPPDALDILDDLDAGVDPSEPVSFQTGPQWRVKSVEIGEEEYPASAGNGIDMVETIMPVDRLLSETKLGRSDADRTKWRCHRTNFSVWGGESMARYLVDLGVEHPAVVDEIVTAERVPDRSNQSSAGSVKFYRR